MSTTEYRFGRRWKVYRYSDGWLAALGPLGVQMAPRSSHLRFLDTKGSHWIACGEDSTCVGPSWLIAAPRARMVIVSWVSRPYREMTAEDLWE